MTWQMNAVFVRYSLFKSFLFLLSCLLVGAAAELNRKWLLWLLLRQGLVQHPPAVLPGMKQEEELGDSALGQDSLNRCCCQNGDCWRESV